MNEDVTFNVAQLLKESVGASRSGEVTASLGRLVPELMEGRPEAESAIRGTVRLVNSHVGVLAWGDMTTTAALPCARCLEPVEIPLAFQLEETFVPTIDIFTGRPLDIEEEDIALWIDEHHILNLEEVLRQNALLAAPLHVLCKEDCLGLCPTCGQNLNEGPCNCQPESDPRWSALLDLLDESK